MKDKTELVKDINEEIRDTVIEVAELLKSDRARDIVVLDLRGITSITDYFIICTVNSSVQTKSIVRDVEDLLFKKRLKPINSVDNYESPWVLFDYNYFVLHIFLKDGRNFYQLEKLWNDAELIYSSEGDEE